MYDEKPKTYPPASDGHMRPVMWRQSRNIVHAVSAGEAIWMMFHVTDGPASSVIGDRSRLGPASPSTT